MVPPWKTSNFVDAGVYNRNEREREIGELKLVKREGWGKKILLTQKDVKISRII